MLTVVCNLKSTREILTFIMLKSIGLFCTLNGSLFPCIFGFLTSCIGHLENVESLSYVDSLKDYTFYYYITSKKACLLISLPISLKILKHWKLSSSCWQLYLFQTSNFPYNFKLYLATNTVNCFP